MKSMILTVPAARVDAVNAVLDARGYGPNCVSVPVIKGVQVETGTPTHYSSHWWANEALEADLRAIRGTDLADCQLFFAAPDNSRGNFEAAIDALGRFDRASPQARADIRNGPWFGLPGQQA